MKLMLVGCGGIASSVYAPSLQRIVKEDSSLTLAGCCDLNLSAAKNMQKLAGFAHSGTDLLQMARELKPDVMFLATNVTATVNVGLQAANVGCPLMIEKPPGLTGDETRRLADEMRKRGILHQVAFNRHYMPLIRELKKNMAAKGGIRHIQISMYRHQRLEPTFYTTCIHDVDLAYYLAGAPYKRVHYQYQELPWCGDGVCNIYMNGEFANGITFQLAFLVNCGVVGERIMVSGEECSWEVQLPVWDGTDVPGFYKYYENGLLKEFKSGTEISDGQELFESNGFYAEIKSFLKAVRDGKQPHESLDYSIQPVEVSHFIHLRNKEYKGTNLL